MKALKVAFTALLCSAVLVFPSIVAAQATTNEAIKHKSGSICVLPNSPEPPTRIAPGGEYNPDTLTVRLDKRQPVQVFQI